MLKAVKRTVTTFNPVCIDYQSLANSKNLDSEIEEGFGPQGLGIITVKNTPDYQAKRLALLTLARQLARLPSSELEKLELPQAGYSVGWSHGKEIFEGKPDFFKGSFYANPETDTPKANSGMYHPNVWPKDSLPQLEHAFKDLGSLIIHVGGLVSQHIDKYIKQRVPSFKENTIEKIISDSKSHVGRLLHYFPQENPSKDWCGWHNDHCNLTGLTCSLYQNFETGEVLTQNEYADENSGLFLRTRKGESLKVKVTSDLMVFQIGETSQILSGGWLQATPHAVMPVKDPKVSRSTFAVFMEPSPGFEIECPDSKGALIEHEGVPSLGQRWKPGMTFGEFHNSTISFFN